MNKKLLKRRFAMLDAIDKGFHPSVFIAQLALEFGVSESALWSDWRRRGEWVPALRAMESHGSEFA